MVSCAKTVRPSSGSLWFFRSRLDFTIDSMQIRRLVINSRVFFWISATLAVLCALATLSWPFGWDQGIFAWGGEIIRQGGMPYRDAWDQKGPLPYYVYAVAQSVFGPGMWGIRA